MSDDRPVSPMRLRQIGVLGMFAVLVIVLASSRAGGDAGSGSGSAKINVVPAGSGSASGSADAPKEAPNEEPKDEGKSQKDLKVKEVVTVGAYLNDIQSIDLKQHNYVIDVYIWFRWKSDLVDPASSFEFTNANQSWTHVKTPNFEAPHVTADGTRYQVMHVQGNFAHKFLLHNYPFDRQVIEVTFEDAKYDSSLLQFVPDTQGLVVNEQLILPGFRWENPQLVIRDHAYPTNFGNPEAAKTESYSRVTLRLEIYRPRATYAMKLMLPVFCVIICTALMFMLKPTYVDARWSIGITALLTIVALQITLNDDLPDVDYLVLMDKIYICAYLFVILGLGVLVYTGKLIDTQQIPKARAIDRKAFIAMSSVFVLVTTLLVAFAIKNG